VSKTTEERGGYGSGKPIKVSDLAPPPKGPAPGAPAARPPVDK
jgi:hypothetical protein